MAFLGTRIGPVRPSVHLSAHLFVCRGEALLRAWPGRGAAAECLTRKGFVQKDEKEERGVYSEKAANGKQGQARPEHILGHLFLVCSRERQRGEGEGETAAAWKASCQKSRGQLGDVAGVAKLDYDGDGDKERT